MFYIEKREKSSRKFYTARSEYRNYFCRHFSRQATNLNCVFLFFISLIYVESLLSGLCRFPRFVFILLFTIFPLRYISFPLQEHCVIFSSFIRCMCVCGLRFLDASFKLIHRKVALKNSKPVGTVLVRKKKRLHMKKNNFNMRRLIFVGISSFLVTKPGPFQKKKKP